MADQSRLVRLPLNKVGSLSKISSTSVELEQRFERRVTDYEIAEELNISASEVAATLSSSSKHISIDAPINEEEDASLLTILPNDHEPDPDRGFIARIPFKQKSPALFLFFPKKEREIIKLYFGLEGNPPHSYEDISDKVKLTRERVRQIKEKALKKLRKSSKCKILKAYLG